MTAGEAGPASATWRTKARSPGTVATATRVGSLQVLKFILFLLERDEMKRFPRVTRQVLCVNAPWCCLISALRQRPQSNEDLRRRLQRQPRFPECLSSSSSAVGIRLRERQRLGCRPTGPRCRSGRSGQQTLPQPLPGSSHQLRGAHRSPGRG